MPMCGGLTEVKEADASVQEICDQVSRNTGNNFKIKQEVTRPLVVFIEMFL